LDSAQAVARHSYGEKKKAVDRRSPNPIPIILYQVPRNVGGQRIAWAANP